jgi:ribosomal protein S12 methylthiotransferase accessory factor YcaO-like protein
MGLLLRPDAYYAEIPSGMYMLTNEGPLSFTGRTAYRLLVRLAPLLDGNHDLDELTADLTGERRAAIRKLVTSLVECGVVRSVEEHRSAERPREFRHEIGFLAYFLPSGVDAFREYRSRKALVFGTGPMCAAIVMAAERSGLREVRVAAGACPDDMGSLLDGVDLVLHAADGSTVEQALVLDRLCAQRKISLAQAMVLGDHAWIGRTEPGEHEGWTSGWHRLVARRHAAAEPVTLTGLAATAVAGQLVHDVYASAAASPGSATNRMTRIDLATLASEPNRFLRHPFVSPAGRPTRADHLDRVAELRGGQRLAEQTFSQRAATCRGDWLGVFGTPTERDFAQIPLHVCEIEVSDPVGVLGGRASVTGAGMDFATARYRAAKRAFAVYASLMLDPRRLAAVEGPLSEEPFEALAALRTARAVGFVYGHRLTDDEPRLVDATRVFPALTAPRRPYLPPTGIGVGYDWQEAVDTGLVAQCRRLTLDELPAATTPYSRIDLPGAELDAVGARYRDLLGVVGEPVTAYDITGTLGVPTVLCYLGDTAAGCASALSIRATLTDALEQVLLRHQARENRQPEYSPPPVPDIPGHLRGRATASYSVGRACDTTDLAAAISERGCSPIAVALDHDPEISAVMPYIVHVVVTDA